ncbi:nitrogen fixation protein NifU [Bowdeniella nasicola]|uniref:Nitrogen fixation protein NifU n=1 Tax=Bowdeniella nasicola TaxID=208480 RepID=A0A1H4DE57_9ACTO|nr:SUF system NifU family Fe-S cluster assembly protein [Bowdeniella nasicola]SEA70532.1 nitrogen fixation protein NifU [Bowdeniella nasicola]
MDAMEQLYQQIILDHSKARHGAGLLPDYDGESFQVNTTCGDQVLLRVGLDGDRIAAIGYEGEGCSISQASLSIMHDMTSGQSRETFDHLSDVFTEMMHSRGVFDETKLDELDDASAFVGVAKFPARIKCALLGWMALKEAIADADQGKEE